MNTDLSLILSCLLAVAWANPPRGSEPKLGHAWQNVALEALRWLSGWLHALNEVLPLILLWCASSSLSALLSAALTFEQVATPPPIPPWMSEDVSYWRRLAVAMALTLWRAEKLESLLQRLKRSTKAVKTLGLRVCLKKAVVNPKAWVWSPFWAVSRRVALVLISTCGCIPFLRTAFPAVALDEFLTAAVAQAQDFVNKRLVSLPLVFSIVIAPLIDLIYFIPGALQVVLLGFHGYATYEIAPVMMYMLIGSTIAWTGHNLNCIHTTLCLDVPDQFRQWWAAWRS
mmetsp:Transcript_52/g.64  ORF Transcript_52/g.64 Transcript_52/m.64 type:complete len:285 (+) Transcript_52:170-1024(+)